MSGFIRGSSLVLLQAALAGRPPEARHIALLAGSLNCQRCGARASLAHTMPDEREDGPSNFLPVIALLVVAVLLLAGWWLFPKFQHVIHITDCVASGRTDCVQN
jgi:hypothetical protein